jgi:cytochrome c2
LPTAMKGKLALLLVPFAISSSVLISQERSGAGFSPYVDDTGSISRPQKYRDNWTHLGTYFVIGEPRAGHSMHLVYTEKRYLDAYNRTGHWPDGAVIVKEVMHTAGAQLTTGAANWATEPSVWFVMVKDTKQRFPNNPLWGEGWGWALFKSDAPNVQVATSYKQDCLNCHVPAKKTDFVYVQGYPPLHARNRTPAKKPDRAAMTAAENIDFAGGSAERGAKIFAKTCSFCHAVDSDERKFGPSLAVIAKRGRLPSGKEGSSENILNRINNGGGGMPSFAGALEPLEKADLIAYLRSRRGKQGAHNHDK